MLKVNAMISDLLIYFHLSHQKIELIVINYQCKTTEENEKVMKKKVAKK
jgi:hypothetical protein